MKLPLAALLFALAACTETQYFAPPPSTTDLRVNVAASTVQVNEISIPEYAINQEIPIQQADGALLTNTDKLWADLPDRAMQASLTRHLNTITDARVAAEPWPLSGFPDVELSVFVEDMIVRATGDIRFTGIYAIRSETGRDKVGNFALSAPVADLDSYFAIIAAHEAVWLQLAEQLARDL
ncbi:PqiC family protein [Jannaschia sp. S6380]|uniref:PqiC family protein n=1 Tax=Jannaschia sp. S6380 TaxID=2926408 RepID=UPI001FF5EAB0|nr:PqiC family protein [Jannaschia sp. S6380]MCK0169042.1 PqiC family protein [Jannaschia sp. S6380]